MIESKQQKGILAHRVLYQPSIRGKYHQVGDNKFTSDSGITISIERFYSDKNTSSKYQLIQHLPHGQRQRLSGLFSTSNPLMYSFDVRSESGKRSFYTITFNSDYTEAEVKENE